MLGTPACKVHTLPSCPTYFLNLFGSCVPRVYMSRISIKRPPAMPYNKASTKNLPYTTLLDIKSQKHGLRHKVFSVNGDTYTGEWQDNKKHGNGTQVWKKSGAIYNGEWKFGKRDGYGTYYVLRPETKKYAKKYDGEWKDGKKHGYGMYIYNNSTVYDGEWRVDLRSGWGRMYYENGDTYEGEWIKDKNHGQGIMYMGKQNTFLLKTNHLAAKDVDFENLTFRIVSKQIETVMKAPGEMARRMAVESSTIVTKASFMKAFGWMEKQNVGPCLILRGIEHQNQPSIQFHRYIWILSTITVTFSWLDFFHLSVNYYMTQP
uniref:MORN repeat-containing protein 3 n=1 Tax=Monopterus albus TaxID=43700 RepID=A0A3Q3Q9V1_MONAL